MLSTLTIVVTVLEKLCITVYYASFTTGKLIVTAVCFLIRQSLSFLNVLLGLLEAVSESFNVFLQDVLHEVQQITTAAHNGFEMVLKGLSLTSNGVESAFNGILSIIWTVYNGFCSIVTCIARTLAITKNLLILFGSGIWFALTLIPLSVLYFFGLCLCFIQRLREEILDIFYNSQLAISEAIKGTAQYILDIPLEAVAGLIFAASIIYVVMQYNIIIIAYLYQQWSAMVRRPTVFEYFHQQLSQQSVMVNAYLNQCLVRVRRRTILLLRKASSWFGHRPQQRISPLQRRGAIRRRDESRRLVNDSRRYAYHEGLRRNSAEINGSTSNSFEEKTTNEIAEERCCVVCQERLKCVVLLPCKHMCLCVECSSELRYYHYSCPVCRNDIESCMKVYV